MAGVDLDFDLLSFWQWSGSDLLNNTQRGVLAEYIVARALGIAVGDTRSGWQEFDLRTGTGLKVEVKSAAYVQSWHQKQPSRITFSIAPSLAWSSATNEFASESKRQADVYLFALLAHQGRDTIAPMEMAHWRFYVVPTCDLNEQLRHQKSISLKTVERLAGKGVSYDALHRKFHEITLTNNDAPVV